MTNDIPLIHTIHGNLPIADLEYKTEWEDVPGAYTKLIESYLFKGEVVRQSAHVLSRTGLGVGAQAATLN